jgi:hypothetical protein
VVAVAAQSHTTAVAAVSAAGDKQTAAVEGRVEVEGTAVAQVAGTLGKVEVGDTVVAPVADTRGKVEAAEAAAAVEKLGRLVAEAAGRRDKLGLLLLMHKEVVEEEHSRIHLPLQIVDHRCPVQGRAVRPSQSPGQRR